MDVVGERCEIPFKVFDVGVQGHSRVSNDLVVVKGGTSLGYLGLGDTGLKDNFLATSFDIFSTLDWSSE